MSCGEEGASMQVNVGKTDKTIRIIAGIALLSLILILEGGWRWIGLLGLVPLATALANRCPLYVPFGINTANNKRSGEG